MSKGRPCAQPPFGRRWDGCSACAPLFPCLLAPESRKSLGAGARASFGESSRHAHAPKGHGQYSPSIRFRSKISQRPNQHRPQGDSTVQDHTEPVLELPSVTKATTAIPVAPVVRQATASHQHQNWASGYAYTIMLANRLPVRVCQGGRPRH